MCGRYVITSAPADLGGRFAADFHPARPEPVARYDVRPTQAVPVVSVAAQDKRLITSVAWGLIPADTDEAEATPRKHFNARADTVDFYGCFRDSFRLRRCLMLADGFYEWANGTRHLFATGEPMAFAAIWDTWPVDGSTYYGCCLLNTEPNAVAARVHDRMPVILTPDQWATWLSP